VEKNKFNFGGLFMSFLNDNNDDVFMLKGLYLVKDQTTKVGDPEAILVKDFGSFNLNADIGGKTFNPVSSSPEYYVDLLASASSAPRPVTIVLSLPSKELKKFSQLLNGGGKHELHLLTEGNGYARNGEPGEGIKFQSSAGSTFCTFTYGVPGLSINTPDNHVNSYSVHPNVENVKNGSTGYLNYAFHGEVGQNPAPGMEHARTTGGISFTIEDCKFDAATNQVKITGFTQFKA